MKWKQVFSQLKKKRILLSFLSIALFCILLFRHSFIGYGTEFLLNSFLPSSNSLSCDFEKVKWKDKKIVFKNLSIHSKYCEEIKQAYITIDKLEVGFTFSLKNFDIRPKIYMKRPFVRCFVDAQSSSNLNFKLIPFLTKMTKQMSLKIDQGQIEINRSAEEIQRLFFSFEESKEKNVFGTFLFANVLEGLKDPQIEVSLSSFQNELLAHCFYHNIELKKISQWIHLLDPQLMQNWNFEKGLIQGNTLIGLTNKGKLTRFDFTFDAQDVFTENNQESQQIQIKRVSTQFSYPKIKDKKWHIKEKWWNNIQLDLDLLSGSYSNKHICLHDFQGRMQVGSSSAPYLSFKGFVQDEDNESLLRFKGVPCIDPKHLLTMEILLRNKQYFESDSIIDCHLFHKGGNKIGWYAAFQHIDHHCAHFIKNLFELQNMTLNKGSIDGKLSGEVDVGKHYLVNIEELNFNQLDACMHDFEATISSACFSGQFLKIKDQPLNCFLGKGSVEQLYMTNKHYASLPFIATHAAINIQNSKFTESSINGEIAGNKIELHIEDAMDNPKLNVYCESTKSSLNNLFPHRITDNPLITIPQQVYLSLFIEPFQTFTKCSGKCQIQDSEEKIDQVDFSLEFDKYFYQQLLSSQDASKIIKKGNFYGKQIGQSAYQPFISLIGMDFYLHSNMDIEGTFDSKGVCIDYQTNYLKFLTEDVDVILDQEISKKRIQGKLFFTYSNRSFSLEMPIKSGYCHFKPNDLHFEGIDGQLLSREDDLYITNLIGSSKEGIELQAEIYLHFKGIDPDFFDLHVTKYRGFAHQFIEFARHFPDFPSVQFDLQGYIEEANQGLKLQSKLSEEQSLPDWKMSLQLKNGMMPLLSNVEAKDIDLILDWDSTTQLFELQNASCNIYTHDKKINHLYIADFLIEGLDSPKCSFDVRLDRSLMNILRLKGNSQINLEEKTLTIDLDKDLSTIVTSHFQKANYQLSLDGDIQNINCLIDLDSSSIKQLIPCLQEYELIPEFDKNLFTFTSLNSLSNFSIEYHQNQPLSVCFTTAIFDSNNEFTCNLFSNNLQQFDLLIHFGDICYEGKFNRKSNFTEVLYGKITLDDSVIEIERGSWCNLAKTASIDISNFHLEIDQIKQHATLSKYLTPLLNTELLATIDGDATIQIQGEYGWRSLSMGGELNAVGKDLNTKGFVFTLSKPLHWSWKSGCGLSLANIQLNASYYTQKEFPLIIEAKSLIIEGKEKLAIDRAYLLMPPEFFQAFAQFSDISVNGYDSQSLYSDFLASNHIECQFSLKKNKSQLTMNGEFCEGYYWLNKRLIRIYPSHFQYNEGVLTGDVSFDFQENQMKANYEMNLFEKDNVIVSILDHENKKIAFNLISKKGNWILDSIKGNAFGINVDFSPKYYQKDQQYVLTGKAALDFSQLIDLLPKQYTQSIQSLELGKGYEIIGDLVLNQANWKKSYFEGSLKGKDFEMYGYAIRNFMSQVFLSFDQSEVFDLRVSDEAGVAWIKQISFVHDDKKGYIVDIPQIEVNDFRPSLMFKRSMKSKKIKPFFVPKAYLKNFTGPLNRPEELKGEGMFQFLNSSTRVYTILGLPFELISRLGLDIKLLIPVKGEIDFQIENKKILFKELKDSVSEGKRSHFFLSKKRPSFIDFDGNIQIDIKMKQHVLLKLTQPFTLSIRGSVMKPQVGLK